MNNTKHTESIAQFKNDIKLVTEYNKQLKPLFKNYQRNAPDAYQLMNAYQERWTQSKKITEIVSSVYNSKYYSRHMHVAYALLKGNTLEAIEGNTRKKLNRELIKKYIVKYTGSIELADSIDFSDPKAKAGGMYDVIKQLISEQAGEFDDSEYNTSTAVMDLIKGGV